MQGTYMAWEGVVYKHNCEVMAHTGEPCRGRFSAKSGGPVEARRPQSPTEAHLERKSQPWDICCASIEWNLAPFPFCPLPTSST